MTDTTSRTESNSQALFHEGADLSGKHFDGIDLSSRGLKNVIMRGCSLRSANLCNTIFEGCDLSGSDWHGADFRGAKFYGGLYTSIQNAPRAKNLEFILAGNDMCVFSNPQVTLWDRLDWEKIKVIGRLPFFGISTTAIVVMTIYYYILELYNTRVAAAVNALKNVPLEMAVMRGIVSHLAIPIPRLAFISLCAAIFLLCASVIYAIFCPDRVKQFSSEVWLYQLQKSLIEYRPFTWKFAAIRWVCSSLYFIGGVLSAYVIVTKLFSVMQFVLYGD